MDGRMVFTKNLNYSGTVNILIPRLISGFYIVNVKTKDGDFNQKIFAK